MLTDRLSKGTLCKTIACDNDSASLDVLGIRKSCRNKDSGLTCSMLTHIVKLSKRLASESYKIFEWGMKYTDATNRPYATGQGMPLFRKEQSRMLPYGKRAFKCRRMNPATHVGHGWYLIVHLHPWAGGYLPFAEAFCSGSRYAL